MKKKNPVPHNFLDQSLDLFLYIILRGEVKYTLNVIIFNLSSTEGISMLLFYLLIF